MPVTVLYHYNEYYESVLQLCIPGFRYSNKVKETDKQPARARNN